MARWYLVDELRMKYYIMESKHSNAVCSKANSRVEGVDQEINPKKAAKDRGAMMPYLLEAALGWLAAVCRSDLLNTIFIINSALFRPSHSSMYI